MVSATPPGVRNLFRAALVIFVITVVIGILNGTDVWDPPRNTLLTHVHAGTLGWITLSVFGAAIWMFSEESDSSSARLANFSIVAVSLYVLAFWSGDLLDTTESIQRPIGGTLTFLAIAWMFVWAMQRKRRTNWNVAEFGMGLALFFLLIGAILGVLLGLQLADVEVVAPENAGRLGDAHPAAMVIGYVVLAMLAVIEWRLRGNQTPRVSRARAGAVQMVLMFLAGLFGMLGFLLDIEGLLIASTPLQVVGLLIFLWRMRSELAPSKWRAGAEALMLRASIVGLVVAVVLTAVVVNKFVSAGDVDEDALFSELLPYLLALDHSTFVLVVTNAIFAMMTAASVVSEKSNLVVFYGVNVGVVGFVVGLITESAPLKRTFTPILGLALLYGIYIYVTAKPVSAGSRAET